jgi:predicted dienelactone hydrolase
MKWFGVIACALLLCSSDSGCVEETDTGVEDAGTSDSDDGVLTNVLEPGPYRVGYRRIQVEYTPDGARESRTIPVAIWYPTLDDSGLSTRYLLFVQDNVFTNATLVDEVIFPVMVHSHGSQGYAENLGPWMEHYASHGWVVAAPDHVGNTTLDNADGARNNAIYYQRPLDISATLDALYALSEDDPLFGRLSDDVVLSGFSFGGYTALANLGATIATDALFENCADGGESHFCNEIEGGAEDRFRAGFLDERFDLGVIISAGDLDKFTTEGLAAIEVPIIHIVGELDSGHYEETLEFFDAQDGADDLLVTIAEAGHTTVSDTCRIFPEFDLSSGCGEEYLDPAEAALIVNAFGLAYPLLHLFDDQSVAPILDGTQEVSTAVTITSR